LVIACVAIVLNAFVALPIAVLFAVVASMADTSPREQTLWSGCALAFIAGIVFNLYMLARLKRLSRPAFLLVAMVNLIVAGSASYWLRDEFFNLYEVALACCLATATLGALALKRK
jgi:hypothetical protein